MDCGPILVVDDHPAVALALAALVRQQGHEPVVVHGGEEALAYVRAHEAALVVLDLHMPGMSGFDVLRQLRADRRFDRMPVVVCTAAWVDGLRDEVLKLGAQDLVAKADAYDQLGSAISAQLAGAQAAVQ